MAIILSLLLHIKYEVQSYHFLLVLPVLAKLNFLTRSCSANREERQLHVLEGCHKAASMFKRLMPETRRVFFVSRQASLLTSSYFGRETDDMSSVIMVDPACRSL